MADAPQIPREAKEAKEAKLGTPVVRPARSNNAKSATATITIEKFGSFKQKFNTELESKYFGTDVPSFDVRREKSAGARELETTGAKEILLQTETQRHLHRLLKEYARLMKEQDNVHQISAELGSRIKTLRDCQTAIKNLRNKITSLDKRVENILGWDYRERLHSARKELAIVEERLLDIDETSASHIHAEIRRKHDKGVRTKTRYQLAKFKPLLSMVDYPLDSLKKKGPEQWLWTEVDSFLRGCFRRANKKVSAITRCRIIAALLKASGQAPVAPSTIKEYFLQTAKKRLAAAARN